MRVIFYIRPTRTITVIYKTATGPAHLCCSIVEDAIVVEAIVFRFGRCNSDATLVYKLLARAGAVGDLEAATESQTIAASDLVEIALMIQAFILQFLRCCPAYVVEEATRRQMLCCPFESFPKFILRDYNSPRAISFQILR